LGSVTAKVLHDSDCPIWTTAHAEIPVSPDSGKEITSIVCAVDLLPGIVHLIRKAESTPAAKASDARQIAARQAEAGASFEVCLRAGDVPSVVRQAAVDYSAELIITGRGRLRELLGPLRSNAYTLVHEAPCPVLSVYAEEPDF
jgi:nucleotide-binding universal stress UspA family protein